MTYYSANFTLDGGLLHEVSGHILVADDDEAVKVLALERFGRPAGYRPGDMVEIGEYGGRGDFNIIIYRQAGEVGRWSYDQFGSPVWTPGPAHRPT